jgi:hypothetical protein
LALNIVHAVEFSRNGRTRVTASRPALRATYLSYHLRSGLRNTRFRPAAGSAWRLRRKRRTSSGAASHLRLEITESQCDFEAIWLRLSRPSRPGRFRFPHRRGDMYELTGIRPQPPNPGCIPGVSRVGRRGAKRHAGRRKAVAGAARRTASRGVSGGPGDVRTTRLRALVLEAADRLSACRRDARSRDPRVRGR